MVALACLRMRFTEPDLPRPYEVPGGKFGIGLAIAAGAIIIGLLVIPFSPASLNMVEWSIVIGWLAIGLALMLSPIPAKVTPSRGGSGARNPLFRAPNPAPLG